MTSFFSALSLYGLRLQGADGYHTLDNNNITARLCTMTLYYSLCPFVVKVIRCGKKKSGVT